MNADGIPDDIQKAAIAVVARGYDEGLVDAVCRALMVERENAAKIAEDYPAFGNRAIASAIRRGAPT